MPPGAQVQPFDGLIVQRRARQSGGQLGHLVPAQPAQREVNPVLHAGQQPLGGLVQLASRPPVGQDRRDRVHRQAPQRERQRVERLAVGPLQVLDQDDRGRRRGQLSDHLQQLRADGEGRGGRARPGQDGRHRSPGAAEQLVNQAEVQVGLGLIGPGRQHPHVSQGLPGQRALAHPRVALDGDQPRLAVRHLTQGFRDLIELGHPPDEQVRRHQVATATAFAPSTTVSYTFTTSLATTLQS